MAWILGWIRREIAGNSPDSLSAKGTSCLCVRERASTLTPHLTQIAHWLEIFFHINMANGKLTQYYYTVSYCVIWHPARAACSNPELRRERVWWDKETGEGRVVITNRLFGPTPLENLANRHSSNSYGTLVGVKLSTVVWKSIAPNGPRSDSRKKDWKENEIARTAELSRPKQLLSARRW